jgi:hypothetical protein
MPASRGQVRMSQLQSQVYLRAERTPVRKIKGCLIEIGRTLESSVGQEAFCGVVTKVFTGLLNAAMR